MAYIELKPCFCGGKAEVIGFYLKGSANNFQYFVRCSVCKKRIKPHATYKKRERAIEVWNTEKSRNETIRKRLKEKK